MFNWKKVMAMLLILGLLIGPGIVFGEEVPQRRIGANALQVIRDIKILEMINELELTEEQIMKVLPILKRCDELIRLMKKESVDLLERRKDALLNDEPMQIDAETLRMRAAIRAQELKVVRETLKLQLMKILSPNQIQKLQEFFSSRSDGPGNRIAQRGQNRSQDRIIERVKDFQALPRGERLKAIGAFRKDQQRQETIKRGIALDMIRDSNRGEILGDIIRVLEERLEAFSEKAEVGERVRAAYGR